MKPNNPESYQQAAERVTADPDKDVWVVLHRAKEQQDWKVGAVLTSYEDAEAYAKDLRDFQENCPEDAPEDLCRHTVQLRHGGRKSPTKLFESWPPDNPDD
jgi:hypothetical protein